MNQAQTQNGYQQQRSTDSLVHSVEAIEAAADLFEEKLREKGYSLSDIASCLVGIHHAI